MKRSSSVIVRGASLAAALALAAACGGSEEGGSEPAVEAATAVEPGGGEDETVSSRPLEGSLDWALAHAQRSPEAWTRDETLQPIDIIEFFGIRADSTVLHAWPDAYYMEILRPYLAAGGGRYIAALAEAEPGLRCDAAADGEGDWCAAEVTLLSPTSGALAEPGTVDMAIAIRAVHAWMALDMAEKAFADIFAALEPGGLLGVIEPRAGPGGPQDPGAPTGYVQESYVRLLAEEAGFQFVDESDLGANPLDDTEHPFGVWTLSPWRLTAPLGDSPDDAFDRDAFDAVGEPDRMVLLFRRPAE